MDKIKVLLFTMTGFGNEVIRSLYNHPLCELIGVVVPKRPDAPYPYYECRPLHEEVSAIGVQLYEGLNLKDEAHIDFVISLKPDLIIVATFNQILPKSVLKTPIYGAINLHPSLLPKYRGATPTTWAIYNGERQTGITAHVLTEDIDNGEIILKRVIDIDINDTDGTLRKKLSLMAGNMAKELIEIIHSGTMNKTAQDESCASHYPKRAKTCLILSNLTDNPLTIHNKIRSHLPYPGVRILQKGRDLSVKETYYFECFRILENKGESDIMYVGNKIILRPFEKRDIEIYRKWVNDGEIAVLIDRILPVSELEHERWYGSIVQNQNAVIFAIEEKSNSKYIGNVWLYNIDYRHRKAEVRILLGDTERRAKGLGTEALEMISWFAFNKMNLHKLYAYVLSSNKTAKRCFEKVGFSEEGLLRQDRFINGCYEDVFLMGKIFMDAEDKK